MTDQPDENEVDPTEFDIYEDGPNREVPTHVGPTQDLEVDPTEEPEPRPDDTPEEDSGE